MVVDFIEVIDDVLSPALCQQFIQQFELSPLYQNITIKPKAGRMVIAPAYFTHTHRGNIPVSGDKYILTSWVLFNPAERIYTPQP